MTKNTSESKDADLRDLYRGPVARLPLPLTRELHVSLCRLIAEIDGEKRRGVLISICNSYLALHKRLPVPAEFAVIRREVIAVKAEAEAA
jgi:hypothetical protein